MVDLEDKIASEFKGSDGIVEGTITVGCGEFMAVGDLCPDMQDL